MHFVSRRQEYWHQTEPHTPTQSVLVTLSNRHTCSPINDVRLGATWSIFELRYSLSFCRYWLRSTTREANRWILIRSKGDMSMPSEGKKVVILRSWNQGWVKHLKALSLKCLMVFLSTKKYLNNCTCYNKINCTILFSSRWRESTDVLF